MLRRVVLALAPSGATAEQTGAKAGRRGIRAE
jgi:hypothetical protein